MKLSRAISRVDCGVTIQRFGDVTNPYDGSRDCPTRWVVTTHATHMTSPEKTSLHTVVVKASRLINWNAP